jgi:hypothetical protein
MEIMLDDMWFMIGTGHLQVYFEYYQRQYIISIRNRQTLSSLKKNKQTNKKKKKHVESFLLYTNFH